MQFDASTIFVLALVAGVVVLLAWAEFSSRRRRKSDAPEATAPTGVVAAVPKPPVAGSQVASPQVGSSQVASHVKR